MNASIIKEIADRCEIYKKMMFHTAWHTFATAVTLTNRAPIATVSKLPRHKTLRTTHQYEKILDQKVRKRDGSIILKRSFKTMKLYY